MSYACRLRLMTAVRGSGLGAPETAPGVVFRLVVFRLPSSWCASSFFDFPECQWAGEDGRGQRGSAVCGDIIQENDTDLELL